MLLLWLANDSPMRRSALEQIKGAQEFGALYVSVISAWELARRRVRQPYTSDLTLSGMNVDVWFSQALVKVVARGIAVTQNIALEGATVPEMYGSGDPGGCLVIATAHIQRVALVTRGEKMIALAEQKPDYLRVVEC